MPDEHRRADHVRAEPAGDPVHSPFGVTPGDGRLTEGKLGGRPGGRYQAGGADADQAQPRRVDAATAADHPPDHLTEHSPEDPAEDDEDPVLPVQAYRDRASYTPERYLVVRPLAEEEDREINPEVLERISSVLRQRSPALVEPQPAA